MSQKQEKEQETERADLDQMRLVVEKIASADVGQRVAPINAFYFFVDKCELPQVFVPVLQQEFNDPNDQVSDAAQAVYGYAVKKCPNVKNFVKSAVEKKDPAAIASVDKATVNDPSLSGTLDSGQLPPRVYIQIKDESQTDLAQGIQRELIAKGYVVPGIERVGVRMPSKTQIRYFHKDEREIKGATALAGLLATMQVPDAQPVFISGFEGSPKIRFNHYELWLAG